MKRRLSRLTTGALALALLALTATGCAKETGGVDDAPGTTPPAESAAISESDGAETPMTGDPDGGGYTEAELLALPEDSGDSYDYDEVDGGIRILGRKGSADTIVIPSKIDGKEVTQIGAGAFRMNSDIKAVVLPESVTRIGESAFYYCSEIETVIFNGEKLSEVGSEAFAYCFLLKSVNLPESLLIIGDRAFDSCAKLPEIYLSDSISTIGLSAFAGCSSLKLVDIPSNISIIENIVFSYTGIENIEIPDGVTEIKLQAFAECENLTLCKIPDSVQVISDRAFENSPNVIIVASPDSYAAQYAAEQGIKFQEA
jgi:hypothetical protein